jgi:hypothetical protein
VTVGATVVDVAEMDVDVAVIMGVGVKEGVAVTGVGDNGVGVAVEMFVWRIVKL